MPASWDGQVGDIKELLRQAKVNILRETANSYLDYKDFGYIPYPIPVNFTAVTERKENNMANTTTTTVTTKKTAVGKFTAAKASDDNKIVLKGLVTTEWKAADVYLVDKNELKLLHKLLTELLYEEVK